ncbi:MAG TPA: hypothetical protein VHN59_05225 [Chitinophagaceae bacterium]|nr:hypothetical protein [Chitinophagaceae bacterium]
MPFNKETEQQASHIKRKKREIVLEIILSLFAVIAFCGLLQITFFNKVEWKDIPAIAITLILPLAVTLVALRKEIRNDKKDPKASADNRVLFLLAIVILITSLIIEFAKTNEANIHKTALNDSLHGLKIGSDLASNFLTKMGTDYDSVVEPRLRNTLSILDQVDSTSKANLQKASQIIAQINKAKVETDSLADEREITRLIEAIKKYIKFYDNEFTLYQLTISTDGDKWKPEAKRLVFEIRSLLNEQYTNKFLTENKSLYNPWNRFNDSLKLFAIYLANEGPINTEEERMETSNRLNENYSCLRDQLYMYLIKTGKYGMPIELGDEELRTKIRNKIQTEYQRCNFDYDSKKKQWTNPFTGKEIIIIPL